jgi:hypothetical protein
MTPYREVYRYGLNFVLTPLKVRRHDHERTLHWFGLFQHINDAESEEARASLCKLLARP